MRIIETANENISVRVLLRHIICPLEILLLTYTSYSALSLLQSLVEVFFLTADSR